MFQMTDGHLVGFYIVVYLVCSNMLVGSTSFIFRVTHFVQVDAVMVGGGYRTCTEPVGVKFHYGCF
jgi:hypothetical protein